MKHMYNTSVSVVSFSNKVSICLLIRVSSSVTSLRCTGKLSPIFICSRNHVSFLVVNFSRSFKNFSHQISVTLSNLAVSLPMSCFSLAKGILSQFGVMISGTPVGKLCANVNPEVLSGRLHSSHLGEVDHFL